MSISADSMAGHFLCKLRCCKTSTFFINKREKQNKQAILYLRLIGKFSLCSSPKKKNELKWNYLGYSFASWNVVKPLNETQRERVEMIELLERIGAFIYQPTKAFHSKITIVRVSMFQWPSLSVFYFLFCLFCLSKTKRPATSIYPWRLKQ